MGSQEGDRGEVDAKEVQVYPKGAQIRQDHKDEGEAWEGVQDGGRLKGQLVHLDQGKEETEEEVI